MLLTLSQDKPVEVTGLESAACWYTYDHSSAAFDPKVLPEEVLAEIFDLGYSTCDFGATLQTVKTEQCYIHCPLLASWRESQMQSFGGQYRTGVPCPAASASHQVDGIESTDSPPGLDLDPVRRDVQTRCLANRRLGNSKRHFAPPLIPTAATRAAIH